MTPSGFEWEVGWNPIVVNENPWGSDFPFAPTAAGQLFATGLETYPGLDAPPRAAIERSNVLALFPRLGAAPQPISRSPAQRVRHTVSRFVLRGVARLASAK